MFRQGDVLILEEKKIPDDLEKIERDNGRIILAYGEATGHAHAIKSKDALLMQSKETKKIYLIVKNRPAILSHEEHKKIKLPVGAYEVIRQREYSPEEIRNVAD